MFLNLKVDKDGGKALGRVKMETLIKDSGTLACAFAILSILLGYLIRNSENQRLSISLRVCLCSEEVKPETGGKEKE